MPMTQFIYLAANFFLWILFFRITHIIHSHDFPHISFFLSLFSVWFNHALQLRLITLDLISREFSFFPSLVLLSHLLALNLSGPLGYAYYLHLSSTTTVTLDSSHLISCLAHTQYQYRNVFMHAVLMVDLSLRESKYTALSRLVYRVNGARMESCT